MRTTAPGGGEREAEALRMLEAFVSVGVKRFSVTQTNLLQAKVAFRPGLNVGAMRIFLPAAVGWMWERQQNLIIRPEVVAGRVLAQLDDLDGQKLERIAPRAFLTLETSPGNYQAWLAIEGANDEQVRRMVRSMAVDWNASRAVRVAGTPNCKPKYAPNFPAVRIHGLGSSVRLADVSDWMPPPAPVVPMPAAVTVSKSPPRAWPNYSMCLACAPKSSSGGKQRGMADFTWCCIAVDWGWSVEEIAAKLMEVSTKAQENGPEYARKTAQWAFDKVVSNPRR